VGTARRLGFDFVARVAHAGTFGVEQDARVVDDDDRLAHTRIDTASLQGPARIAPVDVAATQGHLSQREFPRCRAEQHCARGQYQRALPGQCRHRPPKPAAQRDNPAARRRGDL
jgi:hypothetical protein